MGILHIFFYENDGKFMVGISRANVFANVDSTCESDVSEHVKFH